MAGLVSRLAALAAVAVLAGCVLPGAGGGTAPGAANPVTGGEIEMTPLDGPAPAAGAEAPEGTAEDAAPQPASALAAGPGDPRPRLRPDAAAAPPAQDAAAAPVPEAAPAPPAAPKTEAQVACERRKGQWTGTGEGGHACIFHTRDGGKVCTSSRNCEGDCLARSGTCAPVRPLMGCNEILDDTGRRMTLCVD